MTAVEVRLRARQCIKHCSMVLFQGLGFDDSFTMYLYPRAVCGSSLSTYLNDLLESENMQWESDKLQEVPGPDQHIPFCQSG